MKHLRERIEELAQGKFNETIPDIDISVSNLELSVRVNEILSGCFVLESKNGVLIKGTVTSSFYRMKCLPVTWQGNKMIVTYECNAKGLQEGYTFRGHFALLTNAGEFTIPYYVVVETEQILSSMGPITNLFHFTNLATENWQEAFRVFQAPAFRYIFRNNDQRFETLYEVLTSESYTEQKMEEFLIGINKKTPVTLLTDSKEQTITFTESQQQEEIELLKKGWGYVAVTVACDAPFIQCSKHTLYSEDFIGSKCRFVYRIYKEYLHQGNNLAVIRFSTPYSSVSCKLTIYKESQADSSSLKRKRQILHIYQQYLSFRLKKINTNPWAKDTMQVLENLMEEYPKEWLYLFMKVQILFIEKKVSEAKKVLQLLEGKKKLWHKNPVFLAYYHYLTTFSNRDKKSIHKARNEIAAIYKKHPKQWQLLWFLLFLEEEYIKNQYKRLHEIEEQYYEGCHSPCFYLEAYRVLKKDPSHLLKLDSFEISLLLWILKQEVMTKELALHIADLAMRGKNFNKHIFNILVRCYGYYQEKTILMAICSILIKGNYVDETIFSWYEKGVLEDVRITRLYEYYMYALPENSESDLPRTILMYFVFDNQLDYQKRAMLYRCVLMHREEYPELFLKYRKFIEQFVLEQVLAQHMDENIAFLYESMLSMHMLNEELAESMLKTLFQCKITILQPGISRVFVRHKRLAQSQSYPVQKNTAYVSLYTDDYVLAFEDFEGNYFIKSVTYEQKKLLDQVHFLEKCYEYAECSIPIKLYQAVKKIGFEPINIEQIEILQALLESDKCKESYKQELRKKIIKYCYDNYEEEELLSYMMSMELGLTWIADRAKGVEYLITKGLYEQAYDIMQEYGYEQINKNKLLKIGSRQIRVQEYSEDSFLLDLAFHVFEHGKYDDVILIYLQKYFSGSIRQERNIWNAAKRFEIDCFDLEERMLIQMLFTRTFVPEANKMFACYYKEGGKEVIQKAYLSYQAYGYIVYDRALEKDFVTDMRKQYNQMQFGRVYKIALCKYYTYLKEWNKEDKSFVCDLLWQLMENGDYFKFYEELPEDMKAVLGLDDKIIIEYKTNQEKRVQIHYRLEDEVKTQESYVTEEMQEVFRGIFTKSFTMFFGEQLHYYITEEEQKNQEFKQSDVKSISELNMENSESKYNLLNDMLISLSLDDFTTLQKLMDHYMDNSYLADHLFTIL